MDPEVGPGMKVIVTAGRNGGGVLVGVAGVEAADDELGDGVDAVEGGSEGEDEGGLGVWKSVSDTDEGEEGSEEDEVDMAVSGCKRGCFVYFFM